MVFEDDSITLHHSNYEKESRKISLQCVNVKGKHVVEKWGLEIEIKNSNPKGVMELHQETGEALAHIVDDHERENVRMKKRVSELEVALSPQPLFLEPLSSVHLVEEPLGKSHKLDKVSQLLSSLRSFVAQVLRLEWA